MFSLVITIISIALVAALALATLYYGGESLNKGGDAAKAARLINEGQQLMSAADLFKAEVGRWPASLAELVAQNYLKQVPVASLMASAYAQEVAQGWQMPQSGSPTFVRTASVSEPVCAELNRKTRGDNGILKKAYTDALTQCYGDATGLTVVVSREPTTLATVLGADKVAAGASVQGGPEPADYFREPGTVTAGAPGAPEGGANVPSVGLNAVSLELPPRSSGAISRDNDIYNQGTFALEGGGTNWLVRITWEQPQLLQVTYGYFVLKVTNAGAPFVIPSFVGTSSGAGYLLDLPDRSFQAIYDYYISLEAPPEFALEIATQQREDNITSFGGDFCAAGDTLGTGQTCFVEVKLDDITDEACGKQIPVLSGPFDFKVEACPAGMTSVIQETP